MVPTKNNSIKGGLKVAGLLGGDVTLDFECITSSPFSFFLRIDEK